MKICNIVKLSLVFSLCLLFFGAGVLAQKNALESTDALKAAPGNHKLLYEDDEVRILKVTVPANQKEPFHSHQWKSVLIAYEGGKFIEHIQNGPSIPAPSPSATDMVPVVMMKPPEAPHSIENLEKFDAKLIRVEFKKAANFQNNPHEPGILLPQK